MPSKPSVKSICYQPIGVLRSPFREKFGIPRQPGLVPAVRATLALLPPFDRPEALEGLDGFSHVWLLFHFHATARQAWKPTVRPPRLGGNRRVGVFASRSMFRPNPLGLSVVELERIDREDGKPVLHLRGADLLDGTPVLDIKPYLPWVDAVPDARASYASERPGAALPVRFAPGAARQCAEIARHWSEFPRLLEQILALDPRPAYRSDAEAGRIHGLRLGDYDIHWQVQGGTIEVLDIVKAANT